MNGFMAGRGVMRYGVSLEEGRGEVRREEVMRWSVWRRSKLWNRDRNSVSGRYEGYGMELGDVTVGGFLGER